MKKLALPLIGILFPLSVFSQFSLESSSTLPRANDTIVKQCVEYRDPGRSGANVLWDFSELELLDDAYTISYGQIGDSLTGTEHRTTYYYGVSGDSLFFHGYEKNTTWMKYVRPELLLKYPVHYGDSLQSYYQGLGKYCTDLSLDVMGTTDVKADAYGFMVLPSGDTLRHVLRVRSFKRMAEGSDILDLRRFERSLLSPLLPIDSIDCRLSNDTAILEIETFRWYALGYRYPVGEDGQSYNINADTAAARIASCLRAEKLILMTDIVGLLEDKDDDSTLIPQVNVSDVPYLKKKGIISGGMIPKIDCCVEAVRRGVKKTTIIDGRVPHSILIELLSNEGIGTQFI